MQEHPSAVRFPGEGESLAAAQHRAVTAVTGLERAARGDRRRLPGVQSRRLIKAIVADALGLHLDQFQRIQADPASLTAIRYTALRPFVLRLNDTGGDVAVGPPTFGRKRGENTHRERRRRRRRTGVRSAMPVFAYDLPERFVAGAVGQPGERAFFLQARAEGRLTSVALEKFQVAALAERLEELLDEVLRRSGGHCARPAVAPAELRDDAPLDQPVEEEFRVGTMALAWDPETARSSSRRRRSRETSRTPSRPDDAGHHGAARADQPRRRPARSPSGRMESSPRGARRARCADSRSTPRATCAPARTDTSAVSAASWSEPK